MRAVRQCHRQDVKEQILIAGFAGTITSSLFFFATWL
jgi:hypothetical protein